MRSPACAAALGIVLVLAGCGSSGPSRAATSAATGDDGPVVPDPSRGSGTNATCRSLPSAATLARAAGLDPAGAELETETVLCVLVVHDRQAVRFGVADGNRLAKLRSIGYRDSSTVPGAVEAGDNLSVVHEGKTYSVGFDSDSAPDDAIARDAALLRAWGKL